MRTSQSQSRWSYEQLSDRHIYMSQRCVFAITDTGLCRDRCKLSHSAGIRVMLNCPGVTRLTNRCTTGHCVRSAVLRICI